MIYPCDTCKKRICPIYHNREYELRSCADWREWFIQEWISIQRAAISTNKDATCNLEGYML